ncbi:MAG TPA: sn-glycerol-3-phosphate ABC transporter ATP-binding protein UgpC [Rhodothermales bacterium]|nr:sn-glycerol-3-phosphate ABC transporter ATP-binding protein UgpC [Rhodothermales bacterium]
MARVKLEGVRKIYDNGFVAVHDANFEVGDGEFVVLVGPSGCGKSTTLRMIAGLESISEGTLSIGDRVVNEVEPKDRDIAMVFQNYVLYPHMSVYDNMAFGLKLRKFPKSEIDQRVRQAAGILGLEKVLDNKPKHLSGGQRQRVAVGRAIVRKPQVFLFDEPLSNLDAKLRVQTRTQISKLHRQLGATMIYVTHDQVEAMTMGDRIVVMKDGHVQQIDRPLHLYDHPVNKFVAGFIGSPAMNFVPGLLSRADGRLAFTANDGAFTLLLPDRFADVVKDHEGRNLDLGIRPEHLSLHAREGTTAPIEVELDVIEPMGNEVILYGRAGAHNLVARVPPESVPEAGERITLHADLGRLHLFDTESEHALVSGGEPVPA